MITSLKIFILQRVSQIRIYSENKGENVNFSDKIISGVTKMSKSMNYTEAKYAPVENSLSIHGLASSEKTFASGIPSATNQE